MIETIIQFYNDLPAWQALMILAIVGAVVALVDHYGPSKDDDK